MSAHDSTPAQSSSKLVLRCENDLDVCTASDQALIRKVHQAAFDTAAEACLVDLLRNHRKAPEYLSLVAEACLESPSQSTDQGDQFHDQGDSHLSAFKTIVGHILFTPVTLQTPAGVAACSLKLSILAPLGILPEKQGQGVGSQLCPHALERQRQQGVDAVFVLGSPFYAKFGFVNAMKTRAIRYAGAARSKPAATSSQSRDTEADVKSESAASATSSYDPDIAEHFYLLELAPDCLKPYAGSCVVLVPEFGCLEHPTNVPAHNLEPSALGHPMTLLNRNVAATVQGTGHYERLPHGYRVTTARDLRLCRQIAQHHGLDERPFPSQVTVRETWARLEVEAGEFDTVNATNDGKLRMARKRFDDEFAEENFDRFLDRCLFCIRGCGCGCGGSVPVATATMWYISQHLRRQCPILRLICTCSPTVAPAGMASEEPATSIHKPLHTCYCTARLHWVAVEPNYRGMRLGTAIVHFAMKSAAKAGYQKVILTTQASTPRAVMLYLSKFSFRLPICVVGSKTSAHSVPPRLRRWCVFVDDATAPERTSAQPSADKALGCAGDWTETQLKSLAFAVDAVSSL